jgi:RNA recognition motif-containing protein
MYVGNLPFSIDQFSLKSLFAPFGEVLSVKVMSDRETGRSRGFGFVEMEAADAKKAITSLDGKDFEGRALRVNESQPRAPR